MYSQRRFDEIWEKIEKLEGRITTLECDVVKTLRRSEDNLDKIMRNLEYWMTQTEALKTRRASELGLITDNNWTRQVENNEYLDEEAKGAALRKEGGSEPTD